MQHHTNSSSKSDGKIFYGWVIVGLSFLIAAFAWGAQYSFGVLFKPILNEFGWTRAEVSGAFSLSSLVLGCLGFFTGSVTDKFGPRVVLTVCGVCLGLGYLLTSQVTAAWQIYLAYGVLVGIGMAGVWVPLVSTVARWFILKRGLTSGIVSAGVGVGITIMPPLMTLLIYSNDWRFSCIVIGIAVMAVFIISARFIRRDPHSAGKKAYGEEEAVEERTGKEAQGLRVTEAVRTRAFWIISISFFLFGFCVSTIMVHVVPYATDSGISGVDAATVISAIGLASIASKVGMGTVIDRLRCKPVLVIIAVMMLIAFIWLLLSQGLWGLYLFAIVFAASYGGTASLQSPLVAEYFKLKAHGAILGLMNFILWIGSAIGPFTAALVFDSTGSYIQAFACCILVCALNVVLVLFLKPVRTVTT